MIVRSSGGVAGSITWGVVMLNLINTAFLYRDLTRDRDFSTKDIGKVTYGLGYSFNLLMAVFVEAPWAIISTAKPLVIGGYDPGFDNDKCRLKKVVSPLAFLAGNDIMNWSVKTIASSPKEIMCAQFFLGVGHVAMLLFNLWVWWDLFTQEPYWAVVFTLVIAAIYAYFVGLIVRQKTIYNYTIKTDCAHLEYYLH
ncbi:membrane protein, partial [Pseudomonas syringae pv. actinidiae ICMP 19099]